ncbi:hypothetical protein BH09PAT3_BH09PAT3_4450 [soil metagenome]
MLQRLLFNLFALSKIGSSIVDGTQTNINTTDDFLRGVFITVSGGSILYRFIVAKRLYFEARFLL